LGGRATRIGETGEETGKCLVRGGRIREPGEEKREKKEHNQQCLSVYSRICSSHGGTGQGVLVKGGGGSRSEIVERQTGGEREVSRQREYV